MLARTLGALHLDTIDVATPRSAPVLCLHGLFAGAWAFERLLPMIAARGRPAAALSFRGHPPSAPVADLGRVSLEDYVDDACVAVRALGRPVIIGHSLGGLVAQVLAARGLARAIVLLAPAPPRGITVLSGPLLARIGRYLPALLFSRPFRPIDADLDALVLNRVPPSERAHLRERLGPDSGRAARQAALRAIAVARDAVRVPVLVVSGDDDRFIPMAVARRIARRYGAPLQVAEGHGHFLVSEPGWEEVAHRALAWIDALPEREPGRAGMD